jgi:hypothetical protein
MELNCLSTVLGEQHGRDFASGDALMLARF